MWVHFGIVEAETVKINRGMKKMDSDFEKVNIIKNIEIVGFFVSPMNVGNRNYIKSFSRHFCLIFIVTDPYHLYILTELCGTST